MVLSNATDVRASRNDSSSGRHEAEKVEARRYVRGQSDSADGILKLPGVGPKRWCSKRPSSRPANLQAGGRVRWRAGGAPCVRSHQLRQQHCVASVRRRVAPRLVSHPVQAQWLAGRIQLLEIIRAAAVLVDNSVLLLRARGCPATRQDQRRKGNRQKRQRAMHAWTSIAPSRSDYRQLHCQSRDRPRSSRATTEFAVGRL
jgi:hypothetical protein